MPIRWCSQCGAILCAFFSIKASQLQRANRLIPIHVFVGILIYLGFSFWQKEQPTLALPVLSSGLCSTPLGWKLGYLDPAFNLSEAEATAAIEQAAQMWNQAFGRTLLQQDAQGFSIDFRYDERQQQLLKQPKKQKNKNEKRVMKLVLMDRLLQNSLFIFVNP